ncbi:MAG: UvrD-helicase domain-containing protein [Desulfarculaceae bacterium]|nr:UvrD-helicase domain-containing protein [Desulfarculaceae bacterium]MCF8073486.1 UvrD-helicase domain-containing protein [Desulfarculaceae bacterium]MCF8100367.1 UvrD-helicase domain-containing protein [Desulfarculaceae bacterium]MCF8115897.1 UvrD-helicase domain-containing protein [Desulfarculaceae bacterium]
MSVPARLCLVAGAGAGKTTRLVHHYLGLLQGGDGRDPLTPAQIVAITFTEKAAAEMRARISQEVPPAVAAELAWAPINTIHGFAAGLLRDYGLVLGVDPEFSVLDAQEHARLLDETVEDLLRAGLASQDPLLARLLSNYPLHGKHGLDGVLTWLHSRLATLGLTPEQAAQATAAAHDNDLARGPELLAELDQAVNQLGSRMATDPKLRSSKAKYVAKAAALINQWPGLRDKLNAAPGYLETLQGLAALVGGSAWGKVNDLRQAMAATIQGLIALTAIPDAARLAEALLALAAQLNQRLEEEGTRRSVLGFDDLLLKARDLLRGHPGVLAQVRQRWPALLVDEYQDVNPVQGELVELLAGLGEDPAPQTAPPELLAVGDRKQSIYAFRGAEVAVLASLMDRLEQGAGSVEAMANNWRSHPALVEVFNRLFTSVLQPGEQAEHAPEAYVEFDARDRQAPGGKKEGDPEDTVVEVIDCAGLAGEGKPNAAAWRALEARALAAYLGRVFSEGRFSPGQVAVLLRRLTSVGVFEEALRRAGLDFYTVRGRGFYACREVSDVSAALRALLDPRDGIALAAWLRSPLVGLNDENLLALAYAQDVERPHLTGAFQNGEALPDWCGQEQAARLALARTTWRELGPMARRLHPAELITRLLEISDLLPVLMGTSAGEQQAANLRKLIETARRPSGVLAGGAEAFSRGLAGLVADPPDDPQAPLLGEDARVVRIMSVHQAKGLEFPLVVLPDLAGRGGNPDPLPELGPAGELAATPLDPASGTRRKPPLHQRLRLRAQARAEAEEARTFYVACTRAEERLVLLMSGAGGSSRGWARWVEDHLLNDPATRVIDASDLGQSAEAEPRALAEAWPGGLPGEPGPGHDAAQDLLSRIRRAPAALKLVRESVSGLENWLSCPRLYVLTQRLGLDTALLPRPGKGSQEGLSDAVALGSLVHRLLETTDLSQGREGLPAALTALDPEPDLAGRALALAGRLWDSELPGMLGPASDIGRELPFRLHLPGEGEGPALEIIGEMDLAAHLPSGWLVADYKVSHKADPSPYRDQMALYCLALHRGQGKSGPVPRACLVFLSPRGVELAWLEFTPDDLAAMEQRVRQAAQGIACLGPRPELATLPRGKGCDPEHCPAAGLCGLQEGAA